MLSRLVERAAAAAPGRPAVVWGREHLSYADLSARVARCAAGLARLPLDPGDCVALVLRNRPEFIVAFFAAMRLGLVVAPVSPHATPSELERVLGDADPRLLICEADRLAACREVAGRLPQAPRLIAVEAEGDDGFAVLGSDAPAVNDRARPDSRALYLYTSGSTDTYKRVCCTQANLWYEALNFVESARLGADDTILCAVPLHHSYGLGNGLLDAAYLGATLVLEPDADMPFAARQAQTLGLLSARDVRVFVGVPFQYDVLAGSQEDVAAAFRGVRWCVSSGDMLRRRTFERFLARTGQPIRSLYGSTEAGSIAIDVGPAGEVSHGDLGPPLRNVAIESRGDHGELWVSSPTLPPGGYDNRPELTTRVFQHGWYNTGDLGRLDQRGHLVMTGRKQSYLEVGGHKVDVAEVEEVLLAHAQVREAAVVGVETPNLGGVLKAVVVAHESCREADILRHCRAHLATFKVPRFIEFRAALPRSPLGKVLRPELTDAARWLTDVPSARDVPPGPPARRVDWLAQRIAEQVAFILACEPAQVARGVPFQSLGFDSLRAVELQERLSRMSGVALSITTLWNHPSIDDYAAFLLGAMLGPASIEAAAAADPLDSVPDEEIERLLESELDRSSGAR